jgi:hypothetical protein
MKLNELIRHFPFNAIIPELVAQDPKSATQLAWYKEAEDFGGMSHLKCY